MHLGLRPAATRAEGNERRFHAGGVVLGRGTGSQFRDPEQIGALVRAQHDARCRDTDGPDSVVRRQRCQSAACQAQILEQEPPQRELEDRLHLGYTFGIDRRAEVVAQLVVDVAVHGFLITKAACTRQTEPRLRRE